MKRKTILFFLGWSEANSTWLMTSEIGNQPAQKAPFTCVVYTNSNCFRTPFFRFIEQIACHFRLISNCDRSSLTSHLLSNNEWIQMSTVLMFTFEAKATVHSFGVIWNSGSKITQIMVLLNRPLGSQTHW